MSSPNPLVRSDFAVVTPRPDNLLVLDRMEPGATPDYPTRGQVTCAGTCGEWLWLGVESYRIVRAGGAVPMCQPCAAAVLPADSRPVYNVDDKHA